MTCCRRYYSPFFRWSLFVVLEGEIEGLEGAPELFGHLGLLLLADLAVAPVDPVLHVQQRLAGQRLASELNEIRLGFIALHSVWV